MRKIEKLIPSLKRIAKKHTACENIVPLNKEFTSVIFSSFQRNQKRNIIA